MEKACIKVISMHRLMARQQGTWPVGSGACVDAECMEMMILLHLVRKLPQLHSSHWGQASSAGTGNCTQTWYLWESQICSCFHGLAQLCLGQSTRYLRQQQLSKEQPSRRRLLADSMLRQRRRSDTTMLLPGHYTWSLPQMSHGIQILSRHPKPSKKQTGSFTGIQEQQGGPHSLRPEACRNGNHVKLVLLLVVNSCCHLRLQVLQ